MKKKSVFVTGVAGFVASHVAKALSFNGYDVYGCDNLKFGYRDNPPPGIPWDGVGFELYGADFLNKFDVLLHMATNNIIYAINEPIDTFKTNALLSIDLINKFKGKVIYTSTSSVYGDATEIPTPESAKLKVDNAYDQSKLILEKYLRLRGNYTTLRLSNVYGPNQRPENPYCGVIGRFIDSAFRSIPIKINGSGSQTRDFTYVNDVVNAILMAIDQDPKNTEINIGTGKETNIIDLANIIGDLVGIPIKVEYIENRAIDKISRRCLDVSLAKSILGWTPSTYLNAGLQETIFFLK